MAERHQIEVKGKGRINTFDVDITTISQIVPVELQSVAKLYAMGTSRNVDHLTEKDALKDSQTEMLGEVDTKRLSKDELDDSALVIAEQLSSVGRHVLQEGTYKIQNGWFTCEFQSKATERIFWLSYAKDLRMDFVMFLLCHTCSVAVQFLFLVYPEHQYDFAKFAHQNSKQTNN